MLNWRRISAQITTSGQPSVSELAKLKNDGVTHIINLAPHDNKGALDDEPGVVQALGMVYVHIPVDFEAPSQEDFDSFKSALNALKGKQIHVHCIYNARVSAFFYKLSWEGGDLTTEAAKQNMDSIWRPGRDWADFIDEPNARDRTNLYAGEDY